MTTRLRRNRAVAAIFVYAMDQRNDCEWAYAIEPSTATTNTVACTLVPLAVSAGSARTGGGASSQAASATRMPATSGTTCQRTVRRPAGPCTEYVKNASKRYAAVT